MVTWVFKWKNPPTRLETRRPQSSGWVRDQICTILGSWAHRCCSKAYPDVLGSQQEMRLNAVRGCHLVFNLHCLSQWTREENISQRARLPRKLKTFGILIKENSSFAFIDISTGSDDSRNRAAIVRLFFLSFWPPTHCTQTHSQTHMNQVRTHTPARTHAHAHTHTHACTHSLTRSLSIISRSVPHPTSQSWTVCRCIWVGWALLFQKSVSVSVTYSGHQCPAFGRDGFPCQRVNDHHRWYVGHLVPVQEKELKVEGIEQWLRQRWDCEKPQVSEREREWRSVHICVCVCVFVVCLSVCLCLSVRERERERERSMRQGERLLNIRLGPSRMTTIYIYVYCMQADKICGSITLHHTSSNTSGKVYLQWSSFSYALQHHASVIQF